MSSGESLFATAEECRLSMQVAEAVEAYTRAEQAGYDADLCSARRWTCYMLAGDWGAAWQESDRIAQRGGPDPHRYWDGSDWAGKDVLVRCLHGLGDTLQFIRYCSLLRETARSVTIEAQPKLKGLLVQSGLADKVITWGEHPPEWQVQMEVNEFPRIFRTRADTIPNCVPYLRTKRAQLPEQGGSVHRLRVGLVWAASSFDSTRNIPPRLLSPLFAIPGVQFVSLQAGEGWQESIHPAVRNGSRADTGIDEIAEMMVELDLLVTVDTMNAHLAGALGVRTWTLLPFYCDWRWMAKRMDTPWYPSMRLFRQPASRTWTAVIDQVRAEINLLREQVSGHRGA